MGKLVGVTAIIKVAVFAGVSLAETSGPQELETRQIQIAGETLIVEVADDHREREIGLMFRKSLKSDHGMLFVFSGESRRSFWMKNTYIPLSLGFFNKKKELVEVAELAPMVMGARKIPKYRSEKPAKYVLEVKKGWFENHKIPLKTSFEWKSPKKSLKKTD